MSAAPTSHIGVRAVVAVALAAIVVFGPIAIVAWSDRGSASFGDQETVGRNRIGAATVDLAIGERTVPLRAVGMAPGDLVTGEIEFVNAGTVALRYAVTVTSVADEGLGAWLTWRFRAVAPDESCPSAAQWRGEFAGAAGGIRSITASPTAVMGDVAAGPDEGDRVLEVGASDRLCAAVAVAIDAPNSVQDASTEVRITGHGEQLTDADSGAASDPGPETGSTASAGGTTP